MGAYGEIRYDLAEVDVVNRDVIRSEVRDIQAGVIERNDTACGLGADEIAAGNCVARGLDDGHAAGVEVESGQFSAVRFQRQAHGRFSDVEKRKQLVVLQINARDLPRSRTANEGFGGIRQYGDVFRMDADGDGGAHGQSRVVDDGDGVVGAIGDDNGGSVRRNAGEARTSADVERGCDGAMVKIKNGNVGGTGIGDVSAAAVGRNIDEI